MSELEHAKKKSTKTVSGISWFFIACSTLGIFWGVKKYKDGQNNSLPVSKIEKKRPHSVKFSFNSENLTFRCEKFHVELLDESGAPSKSGAYIKATNESSGILVTLFNKSTCGTDGAPSTQLSVPEGSSSADIFLKLEEPATLTLEADDEKGAPISLNGENR
ncbi:MAG: hypothetical protein HYX41_02470, partial [Bdellovibrio sp.]|nr:hypothetical protein [Bdellovibrio sp.]